MKKGFIFSLDAFFAIAIIVIAASFFYLNFESFKVEQQKIDFVKARAQDETIVKFYLGGAQESKVDIAILVDTSISMDVLWENLCARFDDIRKVTKGSDTTIRIFALPGAVSAVQTKINSCESVYSLNIEEVSVQELNNSVPEDSSISYASTCTVNDKATSSCEAWASGALALVNKSNLWRQNSIHLLLVVADQDPSGGGSPGFVFYVEDPSNANNQFLTGLEPRAKASGNIFSTDKDSEMGLVNLLVSEATDEDNSVRVFLFHKPDAPAPGGKCPIELDPKTRDWFYCYSEYDSNGYFALNSPYVNNVEENDAIAEMSYAALSTGGEIYETSFLDGSIVEDFIRIIDNIVPELPSETAFGYCYAYYKYDSDSSLDASSYDFNLVKACEVLD